MPRTERPTRRLLGHPRSRCRARRCRLPAERQGDRHRPLVQRPLVHCPLVHCPLPARSALLAPPSRPGWSSNQTSKRRLPRHPAAKHPAARPGAKRIGSWWLRSWCGFRPAPENPDEHRTRGHHCNAVRLQFWPGQFARLAGRALDLSRSAHTACTGIAFCNGEHRIRRWRTPSRVRATHQSMAARVRQLQSALCRGTARCPLPARAHMPRMKYAHVRIAPACSLVRAGRFCATPRGVDSNGVGNVPSTLMCARSSEQECNCQRVEL
jgi:hypothetical protein